MKVTYAAAAAVAAAAAAPAAPALLIDVSAAIATDRSFATFHAANNQRDTLQPYRHETSCTPDFIPSLWLYLVLRGVLFTLVFKTLTRYALIISGVFARENMQSILSILSWPVRFYAIH